MTTLATSFVPAEIDATSWANLEPLFAALRERPVGSAAEFERWLFDRSELEAACSETEANLYISMTCDTNDTAAAGAFTKFIEEVSPKIKPAAFELDKRAAELFEQLDMPAARYLVLHRATKAAVEIFREKNVPLQTELEKLTQEYQKVTGSMTVEFDGQERTMPQMGKYQESNDRSVREAAWRGGGAPPRGGGGPNHPPRYNKRTPPPRGGGVARRRRAPAAGQGHHRRDLRQADRPAPAGRGQRRLHEQCRVRVQVDAAV